MPSVKRKILAIPGSARQDSSNIKILKAIATLFGQSIDLEIYMHMDQLPFFSADVKEEQVPGIVKEFTQKIESADGVILCTPEYVFSLPAILKNALEWTVSTTVFSYKPVALIVAAASGEKAFESLDLILRTLVQTAIPDNVKLLIKGGQGKINAAGEFLDKNVKHEVESVVAALLQVIENDKASVNQI